jgi:uncharacterized membrane protein YtjA (UPF0391 family)
LLPSTRWASEGLPLGVPLLTGIVACGDVEGGGTAMLTWAVVFLIIALVAAVFGFGGIASAAVGIAKVLFFLFLVVFIVLLVLGFMRRRPI